MTTAAGTGEAAVPADQSARDRIRGDLKATLFVEAGAGTGKTSELVRRIVALVRSGVPVASIAAITFTEAAAAELAERVRAELEMEELAILSGTQPGAADAADAKTFAAALEGLDGAAFETLHGFARRILANFPLEAGLPPRFDLMDEVEATGAFNERWRAFLDELLNDLDSPIPIERAFALGIGVQSLREVARDFHENWDRLAAAEFPVGAEPDVPSALKQIIDQLGEACAAAHQVGNRDDLLAAPILAAEPLVVQLEIAQRQELDEATILRLLSSHLLQINSGRGQKPNWLPLKVEDVRTMVRDALDARSALFQDLAATAVPPLLDRIRAFVLEYAEERRLDGRLEFHDLLVLARDLLLENEDVRTQLAGRYTRVLIDEFQDTDPLQVEIARLLAASVAGGGDLEPLGWPEAVEGRGAKRRKAGAEGTAVQPSFFDVPVVHVAPTKPGYAPGALFFVGDAKQSIYRFRRADIEVYEQTQREFGAELVELTENFRSLGGIVNWINGVFPRLMAPAPEGQARFIGLTIGREGEQAPGHVYTVGGPRDGNAAMVRQFEAAEIVAALVSVRDGNWPVGADARPARLTDVAILVPSRTGLRVLERALEREGIPFRLESRSRAYRTQEVRDLRAILAAIADPTDAPAVVAALRSPGFGCSDADLLEFAEAGGSWNPQRSVPSSLANAQPVVAGMSWLRGLQDRQWWMTTNEIVEEVVRQRRLLELAFAQRRPREVWQRIRIVQEQARAYVERGGSSLRPFVEWLKEQEDEGTQTKESVQPEADDDAVRIMTIHAAKGLEFPITIVAGLGSNPGTRDSRVLWPSAGGPETQLSLLGKQLFATAGFALADAHEKQMDEYESIRKLYVATTRARDYLVVSLFSRDKAQASLASNLAAACADVPELWVPRSFVDEALPGVPPAPPEAEPPLEAAETWTARRETALTAAARSNVLSATAIRGLAATEEDRDEKPEQDDDAEPWRRGRAGTAIGRAVHAVLQSIDLESGAGLADAANAQATAEGVANRVSDIVRLTEAALHSAVVREAVASGRYWREVFVGAQVDGSVIEGFIDLLYETAEGLVVVDYKTDAVPEVAAIDTAMERYTLQGAAYALALETMLSRPVARCIFLFAGAPGGAVAREASDLPGAVEAVRGLLRARAVAP